MAYTINTNTGITISNTVIDDEGNFQVGALTSSYFVIDAQKRYGFTLGGYTTSGNQTVDMFPYNSPFTTATDRTPVYPFGGASMGIWGTAAVGVHGRVIAFGGTANGTTSAVYGSWYPAYCYGYSSPTAGALIPADRYPSLQPYNLTAVYGGGYNPAAFLIGGTVECDDSPGSTMESSILKVPVSHPSVTSWAITTYGSIGTGKYRLMSASSSEYGYVFGGQTIAGSQPPSIVNVIQRFPYSAPTPVSATDIGDLYYSVSFGTGHTDVFGSVGYMSGGITTPGASANYVQSFPFSAPFTTASDIGNLTAAKYGVAGSSSTEDGYIHGGYASPTYVNVIEKFPFTSPFVTASDVGNLAVARWNASGAAG